LREVPRRLGLSLRAARYHLDALEADGAVVTKRSGRFVRYFAPGTHSASEREAICAAKVAGSRAVVEALSAGGELPFAALARRSGLSNGSLAWHLHALLRASVVVVRASGRYGLADRGAAAMALALHRPTTGAALEDAAREIFDGPR